jgi:hypothetical protein
MRGFPQQTEKPLTRAVFFFTVRCTHHYASRPVHDGSHAGKPAIRYLLHDKRVWQNIFRIRVVCFRIRKVPAKKRCRVSLAGRLRVLMPYSK